jgi:hypothetical protein
MRTLLLSLLMLAVIGLGALYFTSPPRIERGPAAQVDAAPRAVEASTTAAFPAPTAAPVEPLPNRSPAAPLATPSMPPPGETQLAGAPDAAPPAAPSTTAPLAGSTAAPRPAALPATTPLAASTVAAPTMPAQTRMDSSALPAAPAAAPTAQRPSAVSTRPLPLTVARPAPSDRAATLRSDDVVPTGAGAACRALADYLLELDGRSRSAEQQPAQRAMLAEQRSIATARRAELGCGG